MRRFSIIYILIINHIVIVCLLWCFLWSWILIWSYLWCLLFIWSLLSSFLIIFSLITGSRSNCLPLVKWVEPMPSNMCLEAVWSHNLMGLLLWSTHMQLQLIKIVIHIKKNLYGWTHSGHRYKWKLLSSLDLNHWIQVLVVLDQAGVQEGWMVCWGSSISFSSFS